MYPQPYIDYLVHFHGDRDYFECHEILEEYWKEEPRGARKRHWVGLIQIAVSLYHHRRGNFEGAVRMMRSALSILQKEQAALLQLGLHYDALLELLYRCQKNMQARHPYESIQLPITDDALTTACIEACEKRGWKWQSESDMSDNFMIHKHALRDRGDVIEERKKQLEKREQRM